MEEQQEHAILFAATLLCTRKLIETIEFDKPVGCDDPVCAEDTRVDDVEQAGHGKTVLYRPGDRGGGVHLGADR
jgi:hypothetical protein